MAVGCWSAIVIGSACHRGPSVDLECSPSQMEESDMLKTAQVVLLGEVLGFRDTGDRRKVHRYSSGVELPGRRLEVSVSVFRLVKGQLTKEPPFPTVVSFAYWEVFGPALTGPPTGVNSGVALVPLAVDSAGYRAVQDCWLPSIGLRWTPTMEGATKLETPFGEGIADILYSIDPNRVEWPIRRGAPAIVNKLIGPKSNIPRLELIVRSVPEGAASASAYLCRTYGQCGHAREQLENSALDKAQREELNTALRWQEASLKYLERDLRLKDWPNILTTTECDSKSDAIAVLLKHDSTTIRRLARSLEP